MVNHMNITLSLSYVGTQYHGWQVQKNGASIQETVTNAINKLLGCDTYLSGVGRTDAGVHARRYVANFKADCRIPLDRLPLALGAQLPEDIAVNGAVQVPDDFDARFDCTKKEYAYYYLTGVPTERTALKSCFPMKNCAPFCIRSASSG